MHWNLTRPWPLEVADILSLPVATLSNTPVQLLSWPLTHAMQLAHNTACQLSHPQARSLHVTWQHACSIVCTSMLEFTLHGLSGSNFRCMLQGLTSPSTWQELYTHFGVELDYPVGAV